MPSTLNPTAGARDASAASSANAAGSVEVSRTASKQHAPRHDVVEWLRRKLQHEQLETGGSYSAAELAYRRGHNARGVALLADLNLYVGLAEMAACDVVERPPQRGIVQLDLSDVEDAL